MTTPNPVPKIKVSDIISQGKKYLNWNNCSRYYVPLFGLTSYNLLAVKVMNPGGAIFRVAFRNYDVTNILLVNTVVGCGFYIYNRHHLQKTTYAYRIVCSTYGSLLYNFGSVLIWAVLRSLLPDNKILTVGVGLASAQVLAAIGWEYFNFVEEISR